MKVFKFNPETGKRGEFIESVKRQSWASTSLIYLMRRGMIDRVEFTVPPESPAQVWTAHIDAGSHNKDGDVSYQHDTEWVCFCSGQYHTGEGVENQWIWTVLPPKGLIPEPRSSEEAKLIRQAYWKAQANA